MKYKLIQKCLGYQKAVKLLIIVGTGSSSYDKVKMATPPKKYKRTPRFRIEFSGNDEKKVEIIGKLQDMRNELTQKLNKPIGNLQVLETLLEMWSNQQEESSASNEQTLPESPMPSTYIKAGKKDVNQTIFMCAEDSLKRYTEVVESHARHCREKLNIKKN